MLITGVEEAAVSEVNELLGRLVASQQKQIIMQGLVLALVREESYFSLASASEGTLLVLPLPFEAYMLCSTVNEFVISGIIVPHLTAGLPDAIQPAKPNGL